MTNRNQLPEGPSATLHPASATTLGVTPHSGAHEILEEKMETRQSRLSVWALLLFACFALFGGQSVFAMDNTKPRVEAAGSICKPDFTSPNGCAEVKLGLTGKVNKATMVDGRFEYMNRLSKYNVHGRINSMVVNPHPTASMSHPCYAAAIVDPVTGIQVGGPPLNAPYATVDGTCEDGSCSFHVTVVDDDSARRTTDWACDIHMHGTDKKGNVENYDDPGQPFQHGKVEVHPETTNSH